MRPCCWAAFLPGGCGAQVWTFFTYALVHADLTHLGFNALWLLAFGSPVARRFGAWRFFTFFMVTVAAGALAHLAGASRRACDHGRRLGRHLRHDGGGDALCLSARRLARFLAGDAAPTPTAFRRRRSRWRCAIRGCWRSSPCGSALNLLFGLGSFSIVGLRPERGVGGARRRLPRGAAAVLAVRSGCAAAKRDAATNHSQF